MAFRRAPNFAVFCILPFFLLPIAAVFAQSPSPEPSRSSPPAENQPDLVAHETTTFKVHVNEVLLRVVVRDRDGKAVGNVPKEAFQVLDNGKPQPITSFTVVGAGNLRSSGSQKPEPQEGVTEPKRYIAYVFDDMHAEIPDLARMKEAAGKYLTTSLRPDDRAAIYTISGRVSQDFTDNREQLLAAISKIQPAFLTREISSDCPRMNYYLADLIVNKHNPEAADLALNDTNKCLPQPPPPIEMVRSMVLSAAHRELEIAENDQRISFAAIREIVGRLSTAPGERTVVLVSPGFMVTDVVDLPQVFDRALRAKVTISTLDSRGPWLDPGIDVSKKETPFRDASAQATFEQYMHQAALHQNDVLAELANGTGGTFVQNTNDLLDGLHRASPAEYSYMLAFQPQGLKPDGKFHNLKIVITNPPGLTASTQHGYFAPSHEQKTAEFAKSEIENAVFSRDERQDIPVELRTQFFKSSDLQANVSVLTHVDLKNLSFRKEGDRNIDTVTVVSALFDRNGRFISGQEKTIDFHMRDDVLRRQLRTGIAIKSNFEIQPGDYLVRVIVRDTEGQLLSAKNGSISIP